MVTVSKAEQDRFYNIKGILFANRGSLGVSLFFFMQAKVGAPEKTKTLLNVTSFADVPMTVNRANIGRCRCLASSVSVHP